MKKPTISLAVALVAVSAQAQQSPLSYEAGVAAHATTFESITTLDNGFGIGVNVGTFFLRRLSVDELPQLWNVIRGEMSIIGPRPTLRYQVEQYDERQRHRLDVRPGITGWAQIHGRAKLTWAERIELDLWYVEHRSVPVDLGILLRTPLALFGGTYKGKTGGWNAHG